MPTNADLLDLLGRTQQALGQLSQATASYRKLVALHPDMPLAHLRLADAHLSAGDKAAAADSLRRALAIQPDLLQAQQRLITLAAEAGDDKAALAIARTVQAQRPAQAVGYLFEGELEAGHKRWSNAAKVYERALKQAPSPDLARRAHAAFGAAGDTKGRDRFAATWLKDHPQDVVFRLYLGDVAAMRNDFAAAEKLYASVSQLQPDNAVALNNLAWVGSRLKRPDAIAHAEEAIALAPDQAGFMDTLAMLLAQKQDVVQALVWQRKAVALQPDNGMFHLNLARLLVLDGSKDEARRELRSLAERGEGFRGHAEVVRLLQTL